MSEDEEILQPKQCFTTVHDRYEVGDDCCGLVTTETSLKKATLMANAHVERHRRDPENTVTVVRVFDRMARRDCQTTWEFRVKS